MGACEYCCLDPCIGVAEIACDAQRARDDHWREHAETAIHRAESAERERDEAVQARDRWAHQCNLASEAHADALNRSAETERLLERAHVALQWPTRLLANVAIAAGVPKATGSELIAEITRLRAIERECAEQKRRAEFAEFEVKATQRAMEVEMLPPLRFSAPPDACTCGEINARHCPVHNEPDGEG